MVAVVSGSGLGLFNSSTSTLGGAGADGNPNVGRGRDQVFVNTTTGNLIVQSVDDTLAALGLDFAAVRTYNSQGLTDEDNNDLWRLGVHQKVALTQGTVNMAGSAVTKTFGDGTEVIYTWNATRSRYETNDGDGANDSLAWNGTVWTWTDGSSRATEEYGSVSGIYRIKFSRDAESTPNTVTYNYTGSLLTSISMAGGTAQTVNFTYTGTDLTAVQVVSNSVTQTLTRYFYDASHRLRQVIVDLTPADNTVPLLDANSDGIYETTANQTYITTYTYDSTSKRVASITQSDGSSVAFTYQNVNGDYRLKTVTDAEGRVTTFTYADVISSGGAPASIPPVSGQYQTQDTIGYPQIGGLTASPAGWNNAALRESSSTSINDPRIGFDSNGNGLLIWRSSSNIIAQRYTRATNSWGPEIILDSSTQTAFNQSLSVDASGNAVAAWMQSDGTAVSVYASRYNVSTGLWSTAAPLDTGIDPTFPANQAGNTLVTAINGSYAAVSWQHDQSASSGVFDLWVARMDATTIYAPERVENLSATAGQVSLAIDTLGNVGVAFQQSDGTNTNIYSNRFNRTAGTWAGAAIRDNVTGTTNDPRIAFDSNGNGILIYRTGNNLNALRYTRSTDSWGTQSTLDTNTNTTYLPALALDAGGTGFAAWVQSDGTALSVYAARFDGTTWGPAVALDSAIDPTFPVNNAAATMRISVSGNRAAVMWQQNQAASGTVYDAYVARYNGTAWQSAERVEARVDNAAQVNVAVDSLGNVSAAFLQNDGTANSTWVSRYNVSAAGSFHVVPAGATWQSIANAVYGVNSAAAGTALQAAMVGQTLATGVQLGGFPTTLNVTSTVAPYYVIVSGDTWANVTQKLYNTLDANAIAALQTFNGTTTLPALGQRINVANPLNYTTGGAGPSIYQRTTVQDGLGLITTYLKDAQGRLISVQTPAVGGSSLETRYTYDTVTGNVATITEDPAGLNRVTAFNYDAVTGLLLSTRDSLGNTVSRTYDANNQLDSETSYLVRDPDGAGSGQPGTPLVTRYVYDAESHLRFSVSADGRVTEHIYDAPGQRTTTYKYASTTYTGAYTESALNTWATNSARRGGPLERVEYTYDFRGNVQTVTTYAATNSSGAGTGPASTTRFVYDQRGMLLSTVEARGEATATPTTDYVNSYTYDGLGRKLTTTSWVSSTETARLVQTNSYDDMNRRTVSTFTNGLTKTLNYNRAGEITSVVNGPTALGTTSFTYDADGRLRVTTDATSIKTYRFYDDAGRLIGTVDGDGTLTESIYNRASQGIKTVRYATVLSSSTMSSLSLGSWSTVAFSALRTEANPAGTQAQNQITRNICDASGMLVYTVDPLGAVVQQIYDGAGRITDQVRFFNTQSIAASVDEVLPSAITVSTNAADRRTRFFYDGDGHVTGTLNGAGYLQENLYDAAGRLTTTIGYYTVTNSANWLTGTLATLRPALDAARDITTRIFYDAQGRKVGALDGEGYLTENVYDVAGNVLQSTRYDVKLTYVVGTSTFATLKSAAASAPTHTSVNTYDGLGQLLTETNFEGTQTLYTYDVAGNVISVARANGVSAEVRTTSKRYDVLGRVTQELTGEGSVALAALGGTPTQAQIDDVWSKYGVAYTYDNASRRTSATVRPNDTQTNTTYYYYDNDGRLRFELDARGQVTENRYNALGQLVDKLVFWRTVSISTPTGGVLTPALITALTATEASNVHERTTYGYSLRGELTSTSTVSGGSTTSMAYNVFGELRQSNAGTGFAAYDYTYDARGLQKLTQRAGVTFEDRTYDAFGRLSTVIDARGNSSTTTYDRLGRELTSVQPGDANATLIGYDGFSRVTSMRDKLLNTTSYLYNDSTRTVTVTTPEGIVVSTVHNRHGDTVSMTANGNTTLYSYDRNGQLTGASDSLGALEGRTYDRGGRQVTATDARQALTTFAYDASNRMLSRIVTSPAATGEALSLTTTYVYDTLTRRLEVTEPGNRLTRTEYDRSGRVFAITVDPNGTTPSRTEYTYDAANNVVAVVEGAGSALPRRTKYVYDVLGRRSDEYADALSLGGALDLRTQYKYDNNNNVTRKIDAKGNSTWYTYDAQNRLTQTIDALGGVTELAYDSQDRVVVTRRFFNTVSTGSLGDTPAKQTITTTLNDRVTRSVYDRDGREKFTIATSSATGSPGAVTETGVVTERTFDAAGNVTRTRVYRNAVTVPGSVDTATVATALTNAGNSTSTLHVEDHVAWTAYDLRGRAIFVVDGSGAVLKTMFDLTGNVTATIAYAERVALSNPMTTASLTTWSDGTTIANNVANRATKFWYDSLNRERFVLDAEGYLSETRYLDSARQKLSVMYAVKPTLAASATLADVTSAVTVAAIQVGVQSTTITTDVAGRVVQVADADGHSEYFGYDAVGNKTKYVNKKGSSTNDTTFMWTYEYDANHRLMFERSPSVAFTSINPTTLVATETTAQVVTYNEYDALGNLTARTEAYGTSQARTTRYEYDTLGHQTATVSPTVGIYNAASGDTLWGNGAAVTVTENQTEVRSETVYDVFGNAIRSRLITAMNAGTPSFGTFAFKAYDNLGRVKYEIDNQFRVTSSTYDVFGNVVALTRHAAALSSALPTSGSSLTQADVSALLTVNATNDRTIQKSFDRLGRELSVRQPSVRAFAPSTSGVGGSYFDAQPATEYVYNAFGDVVRTSVQLNSTEWAHTYAYYDKRGHRSALLDPKRYLTLFEYDETGDLTRQLEYARPTTGTLDYTTYGTVNVTTNATHAVPPTSTVGTPDVFQGYDREVTYTYDRLNRRTSENKRNIEYATLGSPSGATPGYNGIQTTTFGYDVLGNQTVVKNSLGATFTFYDVLGRVVGIAQPSRELGIGAPITNLWSTTARIPFTRMARDANGNLVQTIEYYRGLDGNAFGATPPDAPALPAAPASHANDRTTTLVVDNRGNIVRSRDATGADRYTSYNTRGDVAKEWQPATNAITGASEAIVKIYRYDSLGQQTQLLESQRYNGVNTDFVTRISEYNAFGEIVAKYNSGTAEAEKEYFEYDAAGRVWRSNSGDGVDKVYLYDLAGNATLELRSKGTDLNARNLSNVNIYTSAQNVLDTVAATDLMRTETVYDSNGNVIERRMPTFDIDTRFAPVAANILITTTGTQVFVNWEGDLNPQYVREFSYRVAGSPSAFTTIPIGVLPGGLVGVDVSTLTASQLYEFRIAYNRGAEPIPFAESTGTFRFDRVTTTTAVISQTVNPQIPTLLNSDHVNGYITWTAPSDTSVTARLSINGGSWIAATKPNSSTFQVDVRTAIATPGSYNWDIEYLRGTDVIAKKTGTLTSQGTQVVRALTPSGATPTTPAPWSGTIGNPWATGTGTSRTIGWNGPATLTNEGTVVAELMYMIAGGGPQTTINLAHNGSAHTFNVSGLGPNRYQYVLTYKVGGRQVAQQSGEFTTKDAVSGTFFRVDEILTNSADVTPPIGTITGVGGGQTVTWSNLHSEQIQQRFNDETGNYEWYWDGQQWFRPTWTGSQQVAWVQLDYLTLNTGEPRTYTATMWSGQDNPFTQPESSGYYDFPDVPPGGCYEIQRVRVYTSQGGQLIADSNGGATSRGITWAAPSGDTNFSAQVFYENGTNNWVLVGTASRSGDTLTMGMDVVPSGRRIKIEYQRPGENWAFNTAIATFTYSGGSAPTLSGLTTSNHDPAVLTTLDIGSGSTNNGSLRWTGAIAAGGRMTFDIKFSGVWQTQQQWTSGSSFSYDLSAFAFDMAVPWPFEFRVQYFGPTSAPWVTQQSSGTMRVRRYTVNDPATLTLNDLATINSPSSPATVITPTMTSTGLSWSKSKDSTTDTVRLSYWRSGGTVYTQNLTGAGPDFSSNFPQLPDGSGTLFWSIDYFRTALGQTNSYARATGQMTLGVATSTTYASSHINSEALVYPSTATQIPAPTYRQSDRALIFTTPANAIGDIRFIFNSQQPPLTVTAEGAGYKVILPAVGNGAYSYSITYQGATGNPYALASGTINVTNSTALPSNATISVNAQRNDTSMSIAPALGLTLILYPPYAHWHQEYLPGGPNGGGPGYYLVDGARPYGPPNTTGSGGWYQLADGSTGQWTPAMGYVYEQGFSMKWPRTTTDAYEVRLEYWAQSTPGTVITASMSTAEAGFWVADLRSIANGAYGYRITLLRDDGWMPLGIQEGTFTRTDATTGTVTVGPNVSTPPTAVTPTTKQKYDRWGNVIETVDTAGNLTSYRYNGLNLLVQTLEAQDRVFDKRDATAGANVNGTLERVEKTNSYDLFGRLIETQDGYDQANRVAYNAAGQVLTKRNADWQRYTGSAVSSNIYDTFGNLIQSQDEVGYLTRYKYDKAGRLTETWREIRANAFQNHTDITDISTASPGTLQRVAFSYDAAGRRITETNGDNETVTYAYDFLGNVTQRRTARGFITSYRYNFDSKKTSEVDAIGSTESWSYDAFGNLVTHGELTNAVVSIEQVATAPVYVTPPIGPITGFAGGPPATWSELHSENIAYTIDFDTGNYWYYWDGNQSLRPSWPGSQTNAWVQIDYMTQSGGSRGPEARTYSAMMVKDDINAFTLPESAGQWDIVDLPAGGCSQIVRVRVFTSQGGTLIADSNSVLAARGITWAAPAGETWVTANVFYENGTNNWVSVGTATRSGDTFTIGMDVVPSGRRIKIEYQDPGESWAFNTAIATYTYSGTSAPTLSGLTTSNHDPALLTTLDIGNSTGTGTLRWTGAIAAGGRMTIDIKINNTWITKQTWTLGSSFSFDISPYASTAQTLSSVQFRIQNIGPPTAPWVTQESSGALSVRRTSITGSTTINTGSGGGNVITYSRNFAGQQSLQTSSLGQNIEYSYDRGGNLTAITDTGWDPDPFLRVNRVTSYRYDAFGRQTRESVVVDEKLHQDSRYRYDAHNRISEIDDPDYREKLLFDVNGNRAYLQSFFLNHATFVGSETIRYTYDEMSRVTQKSVHNLEGAAVTHNTDWTFNARGDRILQVADDKRWSVSSGTQRWSDSIQGAMYQVDEAYGYDGLGRLETVNRNLFHTLSGAQNPTDILLHSYSYDLANRRTYEFNRTVGADHITEDRITNTGYDDDGRTTTQTTQKRNSSNAYINESQVRYGDGRSVYSGGAWSNGFDDANNLRTYQVQTYGSGGGEKFLFTYKNNYLLGESYLDLGQDVSSTGTDHPKDGHTVRTYNVDRELVKFKDLDPAAADKTQQFVSNQAGQVLSTIKGAFETTADLWKKVLDHVGEGGQYNLGKAQYFFYAQGKLFGSYGQIDTASMITGRFDVNSTPISDSYPAAVPPTVITQSGDTLRTIAARVFGDAGLWYVIAEENGLTDPDAPLGEGVQLRIPNNVFSLSNRSDSFKPFDIGQVMGDTTPSQPPPPAAKGCGALGMIIMIVVMVVATVFTAGLMVAATPGFVGGFGAIMSAGAGALAGGAAVAAGTVSLTFAGGALAAAAGSVASQLVGIAIGAQDKFDWKGVATAAIGGGVGAFLGAAGQAAQAVEKGYRAASMMSRVGSVIGNFGAVGNAVAGSVLSQGIAVVTGLQSGFNWKQVATAAISAPLADAVGTFAGAATASMGDGISRFAGGFAGNLASGYVSKALGGKQTSLQILTDAFGNALANSLTRQGASYSEYAGQTFGARISNAFETFGERNFGVHTTLSKNPAQPIMEDGSGLIEPIGKDEIAKMPDTILADMNASMGSPNFDNSYTAQRGDSISEILGTSNPAAIGAFMRLNGLSSSEIFAGQTYELPQGDYASEDALLGQSALDADNARLAKSDEPYESQPIAVCRMPAPPSFVYGVSRPDGEMRATTLWERFVSTGVGQSLSGVADTSYAIVRSPYTLSEGIGNLLSDGYGYAKDALVGPERSPLFGDELPYQAKSGLIQAIQQRGGLAVTGEILTGTIKSLPVLAQFDALIQNDPYAFGSSLLSSAAALEGGSLLRAGAPEVSSTSLYTRRAYLNDKFGRTGELNADINIRGRQAFAADFYKSQGFSEADMASHMTGIDFSRSVDVQRLASDKPLWQYQTPGAPQGNYYSPSPNVTASELGINEFGFNRSTGLVAPKSLTNYMTNQPVYVLRSTAAPVFDTWSIRGVATPTVGGGTQLFSPLKKAFTPVPPR